MERSKKHSTYIINEREINGEKTTEHRYYISSIAPKQPDNILKSIRAHWQIENNLHWVLDVAYREDQSRIRDENSAMNIPWLRKIGVGL